MLVTERKETRHQFVYTSFITTSIYNEKNDNITQIVCLKSVINSRYVTTEFRSVQCDKSVVSVRQSTHAVILNVAFVVEGVQTSFLYLDRLQSVVS